MGSTNRKRLLLVSGSVILLCFTIIVGMTWALFTDTQSVSNHLVAGDLEISLARVELTKTTLNASGFLETPAQPDTTRVEFDDSTDENVFGLTTDANGNVTELIVPGSSFVAKMEIKNESDAAFGYWVEIKCTDQDTQTALAKQLIITVTTDTGYSSTIANGLTVGDENNFIGVLGIDAQSNTQYFTVTVTFDDKGYTFEDGVLGSENDAAQTKDVNFDLVVYAVQVTEAP